MEIKKEVRITVPEGYEIDTENSTLECIKFKRKCDTSAYENIAKKLFSSGPVYNTDANGNINYCSCGYISDAFINSPVNTKSKKQLEKLLAINRLMNVSVFLNNGWKPNWEEVEELKWYIKIDKIESCILNDITMTYSQCNNIGVIYFKTKELAQQAIDILGEDTIRLALSTDW